MSGHRVKLIVKKAEIYRDNAALGVMDPYVVVLFRGTAYKSEPHTDSGTRPVWNYECNLDFEKDCQEIVNIRVFDKNIGSDDALGSGEV
jgi:Ca2+-dependent lipid-binding protein